LQSLPPAPCTDQTATLINLSTGIYYSLGTTAGFMWSLVEKRPCIQDIVRSVSVQYEVDETAAARDVLRLCEDLCAEGLAVASVVGSAEVPLPKVTGKRLAYEAPTMEKYTDMAEMFALDPPLPGLSQAAGGR
jgi:hypothetical protein